MPETVEIVEMSTQVPFKHQLGKLLVATIAAFAATKMAEKGYDATLQAIHNRKTVTPPLEEG